MPKLTDADVITMEIVGEFMGKDHDKGIWRYFRNHWHGGFPLLITGHSTARSIRA